jgi:hypothetical protein
MWYFRPSFVNCCPSNLLSGSPPPPLPPSQSQCTEAESKEKHSVVWDLMPELTLTLQYCPFQNRLQRIYRGQPYASVDLNRMPESTLSPSQGL